MEILKLILLILHKTINMSEKISEFFFSIGEYTLFGIVFILIQIVINRRLHFKYSRKIESEKNELAIRQKVDKVALLFAKYFQLEKNIHQGENNKDNKLLKELETEINIIMLELAIWLPVDLYKEIASFISSSSNVSFSRILSDVKRYFNQNEEVEVDENWITLIDISN